MMSEDLWLLDPNPPSWDAVLMRERSARQYVIDHQDDRPTELTREWYGLASHILATYAAGLSHHHTPPTEVLLVMAGMTDYLSRGIIPEAVTVVQSKGRKRIGSLEERHIGYATAYMHAVRDGVIDDDTPVATICRAYGVQRQTAQRWGKLNIPLSVPRGMAPDALKNAIEHMGAIYSRAGRSSGAVSNRGRIKRRHSK